jgi:hypothetical protein
VPTKKQRRRQQKLRRHEWEEVYLDEEGNEVEPPPELEERASAGPAKGRRGRSAAGSRGPQPPSWRRVLKRGLLFAPLMFVMIAILEPDSSTVQKLVFTAQLALIFIPFSYFIDSMSYRVWRKRQEREGSPAPKSR